MANEPSFTDPRFSREYHVPANTIRGRSAPLKIAYADYGYRNESSPAEENVFLFFPPLLGSRWMHTAKDNIAKKYKVRVINVERPGYGGTAQVEVQHRLQVWQDAIPALLAHLGIKHVSVGCHSAGTVYALDFVLHHPEFLRPERPYLAIAGPWIPPSKTGVTAMKMVQSLPVAMISRTESFGRFMRSTVRPVVGAGTAAVSSVLSSVLSSLGGGGGGRGSSSPPLSDDSDSDDGAPGPETDGAMEARLRPALLEKAYGESLQGMGADAVLMMLKAPPDDDGDGAAGWSDWGDYVAYVPRLAEVLRGARRRLTVHAFHAETDSMVGDYGGTGMTWFDGCWAEERCGDGVITYESSCVEGADHDLVWNIQYGVPDRVFGYMGQIEQGG